VSASAPGTAHASAAPEAEIDAADAAGAFTTRRQAQLWYWQRISAMVLAVCVVIHLIGVVYAVRGGLSAAEILGRTRGSWMFGGFYAMFVIACAVHAPIGLANVIAELRGGRGNTHVIVAQLFAALIVILGFSAVYAVTAP
jgi:fumarate reductase subunit C